MGIAWESRGRGVDVDSLYMHGSILSNISRPPTERSVPHPPPLPNMRADRSTTLALVFLLFLLNVVILRNRFQAYQAMRGGRVGVGKK